MQLPWLPISLDPAATWRSLWSMLPAATLFIAVLLLDVRARRLLVLVVLVIVFISVFLDVLQMMGGTSSSLRFYAYTNADRAVGFFANSNHNAAFLYSAISLAAAWAIGLVRDKRLHRLIGLISIAFLLAAIMIGLAIARSRAGLALGGVAALLCIALAWRHGEGELRRRFLLVAAGGNLLALLIAFQFGFIAFMQRVDNSDLMADLRWPVATVTSQAAQANMPFGTGFGSFTPVYRAFEPRTLLQETYINHAHDDWLELWLEGGLPALALALLFLAWLAGATVRVWRDHNPGNRVLDNALARAGSIIILLILLHSAFDYPLRTAAIMALFALSCGLLIPSSPDAIAFEFFAGSPTRNGSLMRKRGQTHTPIVPYSSRRQDLTGTS